jgi:hypothetical protein
VKEIVEAQKANSKPKHFLKSNAVLDKGLELQLIENKNCICHKGWLVIPKPLQGWAVMWYHHYLQHPGHTHLKETMKAASCNILERYEKHHPIQNKVMQDLPSE